ncbi:uncharacterized mitochondrial protein AtMg00820-like [Aristolochia californica]|uniref:uncharacterized mitochondrial protein AtMg00820-like n=1 Tax=Aristolochia californica TaxID=171875 RepID=UPI0035E15EB7
MVTEAAGEQLSTAVEAVTTADGRGSMVTRNVIFFEDSPYYSDNLPPGLSLVPAIDEEMQALYENKTWALVPLPLNKKPVGCKWVFTMKDNSDGYVAQLKALLVAKGYTQCYGIDYEETFSPVAKMNSIHVLLSLAANSSWSYINFM